MIELSDKYFIAEGLERKCYYHPENENLCIKVGQLGVTKERLEREIVYYNKIAAKTKKLQSTFFTKYYGKVNTNLGDGYVYDLVKDETTNKLSLTLRDYLEMNDSVLKDEVLFDALMKIKTEMINTRIFVGDLRARNLCCKILKNGSIKIIVVDGLGHRDFFPFADWFSFFARKKVERTFLRSGFESLEVQRKLLKKLRNSGEEI